MALTETDEKWVKIVNDYLAEHPNATRDELRLKAGVYSAIMKRLEKLNACKLPLKISPSESAQKNRLTGKGWHGNHLRFGK